ncbi:hypothetical protein EC957_010049 [Mortierella hygrophila]|uniref:Septin-type G domain-containing protein n=1 Tax=Mortierella hygrophila TaxID=979708 RepID=A0A9P6FHP2_9FUNG|nr:hypothetical protein EC957_010049 [Mortierella hygrophila]
MTSATIDLKAEDSVKTNATALRFLLLGDVGVGKSAFLDTFIASLANVQMNEDLEESITAPTLNHPSSLDLSTLSLPATRITTAPVLMPGEDAKKSFATDPLDLLPPKVQTPARDVSFITLPGYSSTTNPSTTLTLTDDYLNHHLRTVTSIFSHSITNAQLAWFLITGSQVHAIPTCAFYFVLYELKPIDIIYMKLIHERVNLVPVITKSDSLSQRELWVLKRRMIRQLKLHGIQFHTFGLGRETVERMAEQHQWGAPPFAVSTRSDADGQLLESELPQLIRMCLYDRFRYSQEEAAQKVIAWKSALPVLDPPGLASVEHIWSTQTFEIGGVIAHEQTTRPLPFEDTRPTEIVQTIPPPPPVNFVVEASGFPSLGSASATSPNATFSHVIGTPLPDDGGYISPGSFQNQPLVPVNGAFFPTTAYSPDSSAAASQVRLSLIHQSTGMAVDSSTRPNEIMDENAVNTVHTQVGSFLDAFGQPVHETSIKVPVPSSTTTTIPTNGYSPGANTDITLQQQLAASLILPGGFQAPGTYLVPQPFANTMVPLDTSLVPTEALPDIWEATETGDVDTVQRHLNAGASPDQRNASRSTLLHRAAWQCSKPLAVMRLLISYGANVNLANENGNTVLQNSLMKHDDPALIKLLLDNGAEAVICNKEGMNTLEVSALFNRVECAKYLLENDLSSSEIDSISNALQRARGPDKKNMKALLKGWQGKEGERKRAEVKERLGGSTTAPKTPSLAPAKAQQSPTQSQASARMSMSQHRNQSQSQITDNTSVHSNDGGPSSKTSSLHHEVHETVPSSSTTSVHTTIQSKSTGRFNLKTMRSAAPSMGNLFGRKQ